MRKMAGAAALIHPGEILLTEFMEPLGLTAYRLAKDLAVPAPRVGDIVRGKRAISADTALRLGQYFGLPAQFWLNLQNEYDLRLAADRAARGLMSNFQAPPRGVLGDLFTQGSFLVFSAFAPAAALC